MTEKEKTAPIVSVGADTEQSILKQTNNSIEQQAQQLFLQLVKDLADKENVTEELKSIDMMLWVQKMNNIRNRATEIVSAELIYTV